MAEIPTAASLLGIPREIGELVSTALDDRDVAVMQRTATGTRRIAKKQLLELCKTLPTSGEVKAYLMERSRSLADITVAFFRVGGSKTSWQLVSVGLDEPIPDSLVLKQRAQVYRFGQDLPITRNNKPSFVTQMRKWFETGKLPAGVPDPSTVLAILRRRISCLSPQYGVEMVRTYYRGVLERYLLILIGREGVDVLYTSNESGLDVLILPRPTDKNEGTYMAALLVLEFLVHGWLWPIAWWDSLDTSEPRLDRVRSYIRALLNDILIYDRELEAQLVSADMKKFELLPPVQDVLRYISTPVNEENDEQLLAFAVGDGRIVEVVHSVLDERLEVDHYRYTITMVNDIFRIVRETLAYEEQSPEIVQKIRNGNLPGLLDPYNVLRSYGNEIGVAHEHHVIVIKRYILFRQLLQPLVVILGDVDEVNTLLYEPLDRDKTYKETKHSKNVASKRRLALLRVWLLTHIWILGDLANELPNPWSDAQVLGDEVAKPLLRLVRVIWDAIPTGEQPSAIPPNHYKLDSVDALHWRWDPSSRSYKRPVATKPKPQPTDE